MHKRAPELPIGRAAITPKEFDNYRLIETHLVDPMLNYLKKMK
jgi:hypothetical protein